MDNPNIDSKPGDILKAYNNESISGGIHFMIFLIPGQDDSYFLGAMLTSSTNYDNIQMPSNFFVEINEETQTRWRIPYKQSLIVPELFEKYEVWKPFEKVGQLSAEGLEFVLKEIGDKRPTIYSKNKYKK